MSFCGAPRSDDGAAERGQFANHPIGFQRIGIPGLGPALIDAGLNCPRIDVLAKLIKERQFAAGLFEAALKPQALNGTRRMVFCFRSKVHRTLPNLFCSFDHGKPSSRESPSEKTSCGRCLRE
jgi:hypothetical protein